jgi:hypothetical protein
MSEYFTVIAYDPDTQPEGTWRIPSFVEGGDKNIYVFTGVILAAMYIRAEDQWYIKDHTCNFCGDCCKNLPDDFLYTTINGTCIHANDNLPGHSGETICMIGVDRLLSCAIRPEPHDVGYYPNCSITYEQDTPFGLSVVFMLKEWSVGKPIEVFHGRELILRHYIENTTYIKKTRCNRCGDCCRGIKDSAHIFPVVDGACIHLVDNECDLGEDCPISCMRDPVGESNCSIIYDN